MTRARASLAQLHDMGLFDPTTGVLHLRHGERQDWRSIGGGSWERCDARAGSDEGKAMPGDVRGELSDAEAGAK